MRKQNKEDRNRKLNYKYILRVCAVCDSSINTIVWISSYATVMSNLQNACKEPI